MRTAMIPRLVGVCAMTLAVSLGLSGFAGCDEPQSKGPTVDTKAAGETKAKNMEDFMKNQPTKKADAPKVQTK